MSTPADDPQDWTRDVVRVHRSILVADLVDSVRLIGTYEVDVIERWRAFVEEVRTEVLTALRGRLVKSLGDGMLLEFQGVPEAARAALELHRRLQRYNVGRPPAAQLQIRIGLHDTDVVLDELDVYGAGVNLAARLATLAGPGETVASPEAREALIPGLDVEVDDLGECFLKGLAAPQRAYRLGPVGAQSLVWPVATAGAGERVVVAVIPFTTHDAAGPGTLLGEVLADDVIARLSKLPQLHVVSRLSTTNFRAREVDPAQLFLALGCRYVVHGSCIVGTGQVHLRVQLTECRGSGRVIWADLLQGSVEGVLRGDDGVAAALVEQVCHALVESEVQRAATCPLPSLESYTILLGAIALMHRLSRRDFDRSRDMLVYLCERHPRATAPRAWLGKWYVMRVAQGWSANPAADANEGRYALARALELDPGHSLALAIDGLISAYISKDLAAAERRYEAALEANPSESLAWLFISALHAYGERGALAVDCALRAQRLSPLDPMKYYYDNFTSTAMLSAGDFDGAIHYGKKSLRLNRTHGPTLRILAIAQALQGRLDDARATIEAMLQVEPGFSVQRFLERYPGAAAPHGRRYAEALRSAGLPA